VSRLRSFTHAFAEPAVRATAASRVLALVGAPVTLFLAATRLPAREQGYFIVAVNIVALAQLFELGLGTIVVQFAGHEWPRLRWGRGGGLEGDPTARELVAALLLAAIRWYGVAALVVLALAGLGGAALFGPGGTLPWLDFAVLWCGAAALAALYLPLIPFVCVAEGCGDIVSVQWMRTLQIGALLAALWTGIVFFNALMAAWLAAAAQVVVAFTWLARRHRGLLRSPRSLPAQLMAAPAGIAARYRTEQRRSAVLWLALHLAPQLLAPITLWLRGGDEAGRVGMTVAIALAPATIAVAWLHGRYPRFGALVAEERVAEFDAIARRAATQAVAVFLACAAALTGAVALLPFVLPALSLRLLPLGGLLLLFLGSLASVLQQAMAAYLRAFRDEGLAGWIAAGSATTVLASVVGAALGGTPTLVLGYASAAIVIALPTIALRFLRFRQDRVAPSLR
jgi:hypothetical protein